MRQIGPEINIVVKENWLEIYQIENDDIPPDHQCYSTDHDGMTACAAAAAAATSFPHLSPFPRRWWHNLLNSSMFGLLRLNAISVDRRNMMYSQSKPQNTHVLSFSLQ